MQQKGFFKTISVYYVRETVSYLESCQLKLCSLNNSFVNGNTVIKTPGNEDIFKLFLCKFREGEKRVNNKFWWTSQKQILVRKFMFQNGVFYNSICFTTCNIC